MSRYNRVNARRSIIDTAIFRAASQVATILGYVVLVRAMAEQDFGVLNLLYAFIPVVGTLASLGLEQTLRRYQPEYLQAGKAAQAYWLFRVVSTTRFVSTVAVVVIVLLAWDAVTPTFGLQPYRTPFLFFAVLLVLHFQTSMLQYSLATHMLHRYSVGAIALWSFCKLAGYLAFGWFGGLSLERALIADTLAYGTSYVFLLVAHRRLCVPPGGTSGGAPDRVEKKRLLRYGILNNFNESGSLALNSKVDNFYIAAFVNPLAVAVYSFYNRLNEMTREMLPVRLFERVATPMMFATRAEEADRRIPRQFTLLMNLNFLVHWPILAVTLAFHAQIVNLVFGGKYVEDSWLLPLIVGMASLSVVSVPVTMVAQYEERAGAILASKLFAVANVGALLAIVPVWGIYGAALSTRGFDGLKNFFIWWQVRRRARWLNAWGALASALIIWGGAVGLCQGIKAMLPQAPLLQLAAGAVVLALAGLIHLRSPALGAEDREMLASLAGGRQQRLLRLLGVIRT